MTDFAHSIALIIGIDAYGNGIRPLTTAVNDATRLADLLRTAHGYETILLTEESTGQPVTQERVRLLFEGLKSRLGEDDRLLFYFAGHGVALDGDDGPRGYLVPQDANPQDPTSLLAMTDLHSWLTALPCRHMLAILDCCFAGAFRWSATRNIGALPDVIYKERYDRYLVSPAWQVLTSAAYDQKALDVLNGNTIGVRERNGRPQSHSPFALALFDALEKGDADLIPKNGGDGVITATELYLYLREQVEVQADTQANHEQTPGLWPLNKHRKGEFIFLVPGHALNLPPAPDLTIEANPYRGLKSYDQKHTKLFFGRDAEIQALADRVDQQPFVAVLGASGTGKSSLVKAGVLPRLLTADGKAQAADSVFKVLTPFRPTDHPVQALAALLRSELSESLSGIADDKALARIVAHWAESHPGQRLVLTIDQFEELVTLCQDHERKRFLGLLAAAVQEQPDVFRLIITLRTDFEPQFTRKEETEQGSLADLWPAARYVVPPMDIEDLRQVIEGPASVQVLYFDPPELVDDLIKEVIQTPGALPLLSFTLSELYVKYVQSGRDDRALAGVDYQALGGVVGSLRNRATEEYDRLPDDAHRLTMQRVMLRMVAVEGSELARRRVAQSELDYPTQEENDRVKTVLDRLVEARLLVGGTADHSDGTQGEAYVEPAHDALVLAWDMLFRWKKEAEEYLPLQRRLALAATEWDKAEADARSGLLWDNDPRLPLVEETLWPKRGIVERLSNRRVWAMRTLWPDINTPAATKWLNRLDLEFTQASVRVRTRFWRRTVTLTLAMMAVLSGLALFANAQRITAVNQASRAKVGELAAQAKASLATDPELSILLASSALTKALTLADPAYMLEAEAATRLALDASRIESRIPLNVTKLTAGTIRSDGLWFATADEQNIVTVRSTLSGDNLHEFSTGKNEAVIGLSFVPQRPSLLALVFQSSVVIFDIDMEKQVFSAELERPFVFADFSPDGRRVAIRSGDNYQTIVQLWDIEQERAIARKTFISRGQLRFNADGSLLAVVVQPSEVSVWDGDLKTEIKRWNVTEGISTTIWYLAISSQQNMSIGDKDGIVRTWDISMPEDPKLLYTHKGHNDAVFRMVYSPNGECLATTSNDQTVLLWDRSGNRLATLVGHKDLVVWAVFIQSDEPSEVPFLCGSRRLATMSIDGTFRTWNIDNVYQFRGVRADAAPVEEIEFSPNGDYFATVSDSGRAKLWRTSALQLVNQWPHTARLEDVDFSSDGQLIATAVRDNTMEKDGIAAIWSTTGQREKEQILNDHQGRVFAVAFRPNYTDQLATGGADGRVILWDTSRQSGPIKLLEKKLTDGSVFTVELNKDGSQIITGSSNGLSHLIDIKTSKVITFDLGSRTNSVYHAIFHPQSPYVATASSDGKVRLWQIIAGKENYQVGQDDPVIVSHTGAVTSLDFSSSGDLLVSGDVDGKIYLWNVVKHELETNWRGSTAGINSVRFSPDDRVVAAGDDRGTVAFFLVNNNDLWEYARNFRVTRPFTLQECQQFRVETECSHGGQ